VKATKKQSQTKPIRPLVAGRTKLEGRNPKQATTGGSHSASATSEVDGI